MPPFGEVIDHNQRYGENFRETQLLQMFKTVLIACSLTISFIPSHIEYVEPPKMPEVEKKPLKQYVATKEQIDSIQAIVRAKSAQYGVDPSIPIIIIERESSYNRIAKGDREYVCPRTGKIAPSHGIAQINECWHPDVTLDQAHDIEFSVDFLVKGIAEGRCGQWSTCPLSKQKTNS